MLSLLLLLACESKPTASAPVAPTIEATTPAPKPESKGFDAFAAACCDTPDAQGVVDAYLAVQAALAKDDEAGAKAAAAALADRAEPLANGADAEALKAIATGARAMAGQPIADARTTFKAVSTAAITYAGAHKGGAAKVAVTFCPMADASWLQSGKTIANPYYGASMLTCGYFK